MGCSLATNLGAAQLEDIRVLEKKLGTTVLAYGCHELQPAKANDQQLAELKKLVEKLGVALVAVES